MVIPVMYRNIQIWDVSYIAFPYRIEPIVKRGKSSRLYILDKNWENSIEKVCVFGICAPAAR